MVCVEKLFTIGQTAEIFGLSVQTLRYYSKIGLLIPYYINPDNGYRYYSYQQFNIIDRIKYLQHLGLSLNEIHGLYNSNHAVNDLRSALVDQKKKVDQEIGRLQQLSSDISEYSQYFSFKDNGELCNLPYKVQRSTRHLLQVSCLNKTREQWHIELFKLRHSSKYSHLNILRQFVLLLDWESLTKHVIKPTHMGFFVTGKIPEKSKDIMTLPESNCICFQGQILTTHWDGNFAIKIAKKQGTSGMAIACEYENNLHTYDHSVYEVQIQI